MQGEVDFGDQHEVRIVIGERGVTGDETGMAAHELDDADAAEGRLDLHASGLDRLGRLAERGLEAEALADVRDVVVDRLGDPDDADRQAAAIDLLDEVVSPAHRAVATDHEQDVEAELDEPVDDDDGVLGSTRTAEDRASAFVDLVDTLRRQPHGLVAELGNESRVAMPEARHVIDRVVRMELEDEGSDDVVEAGTQATARDDADAGVAGFEEQSAPRST